MERPHSINKFVGIPDDPESKKAEELEKHFTSKFNLHNIEDAEVEPTPEQKEIFSGAINAVSKYLETLGVEALNITPAHIHLIKFSSLTPEQQQSLGKVKGTFDTNHQRINVYLHEEDFQMNNIFLSEIIIHELMHANSFHSIDTTFNEKNKKINFSLRRSGLQINSIDEDNKRVAFLNQINEAVTQELTIRCLKEEFSSIPYLEAVAKSIKEELMEMYKETKEQKPDCRIFFSDEVSGVSYGDTEAKISVVRKSGVYSDEREIFDLLLKDIQSLNQDKFSNTEQVFSFFVTCYFDGKLLEIARLVEEVKGKESFRSFAKETAKEI